MKHLVMALALATASVLAGCDKPKDSSLKLKPESKLSSSPPAGTSATSGLTSRPLAPPAIGHPSYDANIFLTPQPLPVTRRAERSSHDFPKPGVYQTVPYSLIAAVPDFRGDEQFVVKVGDPSSRMPIIKPDLEFIPRERANK